MFLSAKQIIKIGLSLGPLLWREAVNWLPVCHHWICSAAVLVVPLRSQTFCRQKHSAAAVQITVFGINTVLLVLFVRFQCIWRISAATCSL